MITNNNVPIASEVLATRLLKIIISNARSEMETAAE